ncbi:MAG: hypothetical protein E5X67_33790 [Mesorhizobium sp.]|nr:MAG: hypothetical protein E5X67_33790 [Mesorhizobium sp.]
MTIDGRIEHDPLGLVSLPLHRHYGAQSARAIENFPTSGIATKCMPFVRLSPSRPFEHVNRSRSTNDAYATAVRLLNHSGKSPFARRASCCLRNHQINKAEELAIFRKSDRTQLQDAHELGQESAALKPFRPARRQRPGLGSPIANGRLSGELQTSSHITNHEGLCP